MRPIDADEYVTVWLYDDEREEEYTERMTIAESLDHLTDEGCPIEIEPKRGEWLWDDGHFCSECHKWAIYDASLEERLFDFCPNCGARMKGKDNE